MKTMMFTLLCMIVPIASCAAADHDAQTTDLSEGVFTEDQAIEGEEVYFTQCVQCHLENMTGREPAPALAGQEFISRWSGRSVAELITQTTNTMPPGNPDALSSEQYVNVVAFILEANGALYGASPLNLNEAEDIEIKGL